MLVVFNVCQVIGYYGFANWVPSLLVAKGIEVTKGLAYSAIIAVANPIGQLLAMQALASVTKASRSLTTWKLDT
jgi:putative MFS transporter